MAVGQAKMSRLDKQNPLAKKLMELRLASIPKLFSLGEGSISFGGPSAERF
jgi:hypothetical protein